MDPHRPPAMTATNYIITTLAGNHGTRTVGSRSARLTYVTVASPLTLSNPHQSYLPFGVKLFVL